MKLAQEDYVHPVVGASEPGRAWVPVWRFRLVALVVVAALAYGVVFLVRLVSGEFDGDPIPDNPQGLLLLRF